MPNPSINVTLLGLKNRYFGHTDIYDRYFGAYGWVRIFSFYYFFTSLTISHIKGPQTFILQSVGHLSNFYIMPGTFRNHVEICVWIIANFSLISRVELQKMFKRDKAILFRKGKMWDEDSSKASEQSNTSSRLFSCRGDHLKILKMHQV